MATNPDWDPLPHERQFYRHRDTGDRAYLVRRGGKDCIRLDRGPVHAYDVAKVFNEAEWIPEDPHKPKFSEIQIAMVSFEADKALCRQMGEVKKGRREWLNLSDDQRIKWMREGPQEPTRAALYAAIKGAMGERPERPV